VYQGNTPIMGEDGHTNPEVINRSADLAGALMGGGMPMAEKGAAGIFAGRLAKTADQSALDLAQQMQAGGMDRHQIWDATGWFQGADSKWRFEIPDDALSVRTGYGAGLEFGEGEAFGRNAPKIEHEALTQAYPQTFDYLAHDVNIARDVTPGGRFMPDGPGQNEQFYYGHKPVLPTLFVYSPTTQQAHSIAAHELQHAVQAHEQFAPGSSPELMRDAAVKAGVGPDKLNDATFEAYRRAAGEVEARNVQSRLNLTPQQRRAMPPWMTEDVPIENQIVRTAPPSWLATALSQYKP
jgi:hypothetical protein